MKKIELLAPAGNMDCLKAAVSAGCDAIYLGLTSFSARAFAGNFTREEFQEAIRYCHIRGVKIYVTMNTMLYETEMENAKSDVQFLYENDADGLLIQDPGLFHYVRTCYPDFDVHCSTQMHIHNLSGVKYMKEEGASRVVLARETPIELIREACKLGVEIEVFVYGAICISYSGQCLMSSASKNRSANKGMCAQCCRLRYYDENGEALKEGEYLLSPKDLNVIDKVPELIEAGVSSLKIEGRMKRPEYVYLAVNTFRHAIDAYYEQKEYSVSKKREKDLKLMFNRGFSHGHLFHDDVIKRMSQRRPNHMGITIGKVLKSGKNDVTVELTDSLYQRDGLRILHEGEDIGLTAVKIEKNGKLVNEAGRGDTVILQCHGNIRPSKGDLLQKTSDVRLIEETDRLIEEGRDPIPVSVSYSANVNQPLILTASDNEGNTVSCESNIALDPAKKAPLTREKLESSLNRTGDTPYVITSFEGDIGNVFLPVSVINETRRQLFEALDNARALRHERMGMQEYSLVLKEDEKPSARILCISDTKHNDTDVLDIETLPVINESLSEKQELNGVMLSSMGDMYSIRNHCYAGYTMNIANSYAIAYFLSKGGFDGLVFSSEISSDNIQRTLDAFSMRYGFAPVTYRLVYGKRVLMYIKDGFRNDHEMKIMKDYHGKKFQLSYNNGVTEIHEPDVFISENPYCYGSVVILENGEEGHEILEEAYEEISGRI